MNIIQLVTNPGLYTVSDRVPVGLLIAIWAFIALSVLGSAYFSDLLGSQSRAKSVSFIFIVVLGFLTVVFFAVQEYQENTKQAEASDAYNKSITSWLDDGYQITATAEQTDRLINGEAFVTDYSGMPTTVSLLETFDGKLALVDEQRVPLPTTVRR